MLAILKLSNFEDIKKTVKTGDYFEKNTQFNINDVSKI